MRAGGRAAAKIKRDSSSIEKTLSKLSLIPKYMPDGKSRGVPLTPMDITRLKGLIGLLSEASEVSDNTSPPKS